MDFTDGIMEINVNHILCTSWSELEQAALPEVVAFLREWYDGSPYIVAHTSGSTGIPKELKLLKCDMKLRLNSRMIILELIEHLFCYCVCLPIILQENDDSKGFVFRRLFVDCLSVFTSLGQDRRKD
ncbi:MAG: hypothetical protein ACLSG8_03725 [Barnesiella sp.]